MRLKMKKLLIDSRVRKVEYEYLSRYFDVIKLPLSNDVYEEIGKKVYEKHVLEGEISIENEIEEYCTKLDVLSDEIDSLLKQCLELKDKKQCPKCYSEIEKEMKFCPNCGYKQIIKDYLQEELEDSKQNEQENQDEKEKTNLEKTVAIESDIDIEENNEEQEE